MIDFNSVQFFHSSKYSFVGIKKNEGVLYFCLPKGFNESIDTINTFEKKRDLFFLFYKIFDVFKKICIDKGFLDQSNNFGKKDRDGVIKFSKGSEIEDDGDDVENIFYAKLDIIGSLLDVYDEPKILSLAYRLGRSDKFDVSQIHKYLHQAVYLPNNAAYVDQMLLPKKVLQFESTDIVAMYCYLFCEVKEQLKENVSTEITALSERFHEKYLRSGDSLFDEQTYEQVLDTLKDALEKIDHNTAIKDADYWQYYEAIELFLYGDLNKEEDGEIWGVSNFCDVWESMCLTYLANNLDSSCLLHLDHQYVSSRILDKIKETPKIINLENVFRLNQGYLNPDAVVFSSVINKIIRNPGKIHYKVSRSEWDDFGYKTSVSGDIDCKITYIGRSTETYTFDHLKKLYPLDTLDRIQINKRLPEDFYSFWSLKKIDRDEILKMCSFNHFFFLALEKGITKWNIFVEEILKPLNININWIRNTYSTYNVFTESLLRRIPPRRLEEKFTEFMDGLSGINSISDIDNVLPNTEIIDIKYMTSDYLKNSSNIEEIKCRSVRKQFVYEHLIQKYLERRKDKFSELSIRSSFWIPSYRPEDPKLIENGETFMDGYIQLKNINFTVLAEKYIV
ncbi:MAG: hypothetical protein ACK456_04110 [Pseudanabaenaceae cyanobacterium]|jgi:hypothetical protein